MAKKRGQGEGSIAQRPDGTWCARITIGRDADGKQKRKAFYGKTRKEVQEKMALALGEVGNGGFTEPSKMTVSEWLDIWLREYKWNKIKPKTFQTIYGHVEKHIMPALGGYTLKELRPETIQRFANNLTNETNLMASTACAVYMSLKNALRQAHKNGLLQMDICEHVIPPKKAKTEIKVLTKQEQVRFIQAAQRTTHGEYFILLLATGMRLGEASALTWGDIDFEKGLISVNKSLSYVKDPYKADGRYEPIIGTPKTRRSVRLIPLLPDVAQMLKSYKRISDCLSKKNEYTQFVFKSLNGTPHLPQCLREILKRILSRADISPTDYHIHCLRHTFATRGLENGIPLRVMQELLGHSNINITANLYTHVLPETKADEIMKLADTINLQGDTDNAKGA